MGNKKAVICFCVEGDSDIAALEDSFQELFDDKFGDDIKVVFRKANEDITSKAERIGKSERREKNDGEEYKDVRQILYELFFKEYKDIRWVDFTHIIQIVDLDGAYVNESKINYFNQDEEKFADSFNEKQPKDTLYFDTHIAVREDLSNMIRRNKLKRRNLETLLGSEEIEMKSHAIPYEVYYFSSNMDHFLHDEPNMNSRYKVGKAKDFADFNSDIDSFCEYFENSKYSARGDYRSTWKSVQKGSNSLKRGSNLIVLIDKIRNSDLEDWA